MGASSCWAGAASLCWVVMGMPSFQSSWFRSDMKEPTRGRMTPKYWSSISCPLGAGAPKRVRPV